ncbi:MAG: hypothetical protein OEZ34_14820, partial [Spirochaetia bacterium]|nr:hypothetical protein [Spirochaetia bacterium]
SYPDDPDANYLMGNTLMLKQKFSEAESHYKKNIQSEKPSEDSYINLAIAYHQMGKTDDAYNTLSGYIKKSGTQNALAYKNAGILAESLDKTTEAKKYYGRYLELNPNGDDTEAVSKWRGEL